MAFGVLARAAAAQRAKHAPATVTPVTFSVGGGLRGLLPCPEDSNGRIGVRVGAELGSDQVRIQDCDPLGRGG